MKSIIQNLLGRALTTLPEATYCTSAAGGTADACLSSQTPHVCHISPRLSNVPLIYTCWAQRSIGVRRSLRASITQRALLLPFKIHLNLFTGANVQPRADAMILMPHCEKCFTAVFGWKQLGTSALHCFDSVSEQKVI